MALEILISEYDSDDTAEAGTTTTNIKMTDHGLAVGDYIINSTRNSVPPAFDNIASRRVTAVPDDDNVTVAAITDQTSGDTIKKFIHKNRINLLRPKTLSILRKEDHRHSCSFTLISTISYIPRAGQNLVIKDSGTVIFGGIINSVKNRKISNTPKIFFKVSSNGYTDIIPTKRTVSNTHTDTDSGTIVAFYVDNYLYEEGVSKGTIDAGATIAMKDAVCVSIKEIFDDLKEASGFKLYIDDLMALHFLQEDAVVDAPHDLDKDTFTAFRDVEFEETLNNYRNKQFVRGSIGSDGYLIQFNSTDADEVTARQNIEGNSGYYGNVLNNSSIENAADAEIAADNLIKKSGTTLPNLIGFNTRYTDFEPNTRLRVDLPDYGISESYYLIETVEIYDINGISVKSRIQVTQRDKDDFSTQKSHDWVDYFSDLVKAAREGQKGSGGTLVADDSGNLYSVKIWVQDEVPTMASAKALHVDTDDWSRVDLTEIAINTLLAEDCNEFISITATCTVTLFTAVGHAGQMLYFVNNGVDDDVATIDADGAETISKELTLLLFPTESALLMCDGAGWSIV